ncbi:hypothetical protein EJ377_04310 [Chryseobacterium arthrosphaerae]|uniref:Uncharacterized protein n=1 Tax=Chryseobacterium arthrosphaerae TaxID=651561 RepID=A0A3S0N4V7_9FLAO|nr:hypothetical protein EJ377_04310 [Chryseobacterium arthrosphaerae]
MKIRNIFTFHQFLSDAIVFRKRSGKERNRKPAVTILIQPFKDLEPDDVDKITKNKKVYPNVKVLSAIDFLKTLIIKKETGTEQIQSLVLNSRTKDGL